ncbi:hypothetical protein JOY44_10820 [Phormidium sp. CLA17]|uniref:hypothetical protein n=1 Tax=Leptolyngbya sp. Cla-17 TaxID=2803751 RepID=UPI0014914802|nr:hypothetical protein [Leptolyngbya sp. Cla-17]MBM0742108.1 hypothetical protein [Leptolyngbya sp. Cla-17]
MNAAEQATSLETASKIAAIVNLFKAEFPDARADLKPWANDPDTREWVDPDSIDIAFHLPGFSRLFQSRSILLQIRFHADGLTSERRVIGVEMAGFDHRGKQWRLSTIESWLFEGRCSPVVQVSDRLKDFLKQALELFNSLEC